MPHHRPFISVLLILFDSIPTAWPVRFVLSNSRSNILIIVLLTSIVVMEPTARVATRLETTLISVPFSRMLVSPPQNLKIQLLSWLLDLICSVGRTDLFTFMTNYMQSNDERYESPKSPTMRVVPNYFCLVMKLSGNTNGAPMERVFRLLAHLACLPGLPRVLTWVFRSHVIANVGAHIRHISQAVYYFNRIVTLFQVCGFYFRSNSNGSTRLTFIPISRFSVPSDLHMALQWRNPPQLYEDLHPFSTHYSFESSVGLHPRHRLFLRGNLPDLLVL